MPRQLEEGDDAPLSEWKEHVRASALRSGQDKYDNRTVQRQRYSPSLQADSSQSLYTRAEARKPLIDQTSNQWQDEKSSYATFEDERDSSFCDLEGEGSCPNLTRAAIVSRRFRKMAFILLLFLGLVLWVWISYFRPRLLDDQEMMEGFLVRENGTYGAAKGGHFDGVRIQDLDTKLVPGGKNDPEGKKRLVFVGDIHGCATELKKLLQRIGFDEKLDHLIAVGDVISKGPENVEVLDELIRVGASSVRGNHEDRLLALAPSVLETGSVPVDSMSKDTKLLRQLSKQHLRYLRDMPLVLRIPALPQAKDPSRKSKSTLAEDIVVVHAGLVPAVSLQKQDPYFVMNMRAIHTKTHLPLVEAEDKKGKSKPWHDIWGWYNDRLFQRKSLKDFAVLETLEDEPEKASTNSWFDSLWPSIKKKYPKPQVVVYGHRSKEGLQIHRWTKGLDTGCVKGEELTALVLDARGKQEIVQVDCKKHT